MFTAFRALILIASVFPRFLDAWDKAATARLEARFAAIRAAGDPVTMEELGALYPKLPPEKNGARSYRAAWERMDRLEEGDEDLFEREPALSYLGADTPDELDDETLRLLKEHLDRHRDAFALLDKATDFDVTRFALDFTAVPMPPISDLAVRLGQSTKVYARAALYHAHKGDADKAGTAIWRALRVLRATRETPLLIGAVLHFSYTSTAVSVLDRTLSRVSIPPARLERIEAELEACTEREILQRALIGERCYGVGFYREYVFGDRDFQEAVGDFLVPDLPWNVIRRIIPRGHVKDGQCAVLDFQADEIAAARRPDTAWMVEWIRMAETGDSRVPRCYVFPHIGANLTMNAYQAIRDITARCDAARVALACLRYRAKHKRLPDTLAVLQPGFLHALPVDPYDGKPLRYRKDARGFVVYAIGRDGKDDGGDTARSDAPNAFELASSSIRGSA